MACDKAYKKVTMSKCDLSARILGALAFAACPFNLAHNQQCDAQAKPLHLAQCAVVVFHHEMRGMDH